MHCMHAYCSRRPEKGFGFSRTGLQVVVSCHVGGGAWTPAPQEQQVKRSYPLSPLPGPALTCLCGCRRFKLTGLTLVQEELLPTKPSPQSQKMFFFKTHLRLFKLKIDFFLYSLFWWGLPFLTPPSSSPNPLAICLLRNNLLRNNNKIQKDKTNRNRAKQTEEKS